MAFKRFKKRTTKKPRFKKPRGRKLGQRIRRNRYDMVMFKSPNMPNVAYTKMKLSIPLKQYLTLVSANQPVGGEITYNPNISLAVLQNGLAPWDDSGQAGGYDYINQNIVGGDTNLLPHENSPYVQGLQTFAPWFRKYVVVSSKVKFRVISSPSVWNHPTSQATTDVKRTRQWPIMASSGAFFCGFEEGAGDNITQEQLNTLTNTQLINNKGFKSRLIANSGGHNAATLSMARKTSKLAGIRDIRDNSKYYGKIGYSTDGLNTIEVSNPSEKSLMYLRLSGTDSGFLNFPITDPPTYTIPQISVGVAIDIEMNVCFFARRTYSLFDAPSSVAPPSV